MSEDTSELAISHSFEVLSLIHFGRYAANLLAYPHGDW
jgi:hypothetical protein